jgi:hypothetical protein
LVVDAATLARDLDGLLTAVVRLHASLDELGDRVIQLRVRPLRLLLSLTGPREMDHREGCGAVGEVEEHVVIVCAPGDGDRTAPREHVPGTDLPRELGLETGRGRAPRIEPFEIPELRQHARQSSTSGA